jgi:Protein of unknown function (DUF2785)
MHAHMSRPPLFWVMLLGGMLSASMPAWASDAGCPPAGFDRAALRALRMQHFAIADDKRRQALAQSLLACLSSPDSELRDQIGYEAYDYWRSANALPPQTWSAIESSLLPLLDDSANDPQGVARPFAALVLAEVVHIDRNAAVLDAQRRQALLDAAIRYYTGLRDYRGFDDDVGWRHGVAHGADLLGELAQEPSFGRRELDRILAAIATQVVPRNDSVYVFGESERVAAATVAVAQRHLHAAGAWKTWLSGVAAPTPLPHWAEAWQSRSGVARWQNTMNYLLALYADFAQSDDAALNALAAPVAEAMRSLR